jgi:hypothetical protein
MNAAIKQIAEKLQMDENELLRQSLRAFLLERLRLLEAEKRARCARWGVRSLEEFEQLLIDNPDEESKMLEDFQEVDYLTHHVNEIRKWLEEIP